MTSSLKLESVTNQFLRSIIPQGYRICLSSSRPYPNPGRRKQNFRNTFLGANANGAFTDAINHAIAETDTNWYYALGGIGPLDSREQSNIEAIKTLVIDADAKDKPGYFHDKKEVGPALAALKAAVPELPAAALVDSGNGMQVYYRFTDAISPAEWLTIANLFVKVARAVDERLMAEPQSTRDYCRVFRIPFTTNAKKPERKECKLIREGGAAKSADIKAGLIRAAVALKVNMTEDVVGGELFSGGHKTPDHLKNIALDREFGQGIHNKLGNQFVDLPFIPIMQGCKQIKQMVLDQNNVSEPEWMLLLRVINTTRDPEKNGHLASHKYHGYNKSDMLRRLQRIDQNFGASTTSCKEFEGYNPKACRGCPHKDDIWTPSQLARLGEQAKVEQAAKAEAIEKAAVAAQAPTGYIPQPSTVKQVTVQQAGGYEVTSLHVKKGKNDPVLMPVFDAHINIIGCSDMLDSAVVSRREERKTSDRRIHLNVRTQRQSNPVTIPSRVLTGTAFPMVTEVFRDMGVTFERGPAEQRTIMDYLSEVNKLASSRVKHYRPHKGWRKTGRRGNWPFVAGARTFNPDGTVTENYTVSEHKGLNESNHGFMERVCSGVPQGQIDRWQRGMGVYTGRNMGVSQLLLLSGLTNLLLPLMSEDKGGIVLALSGASGAGKTTLLHFLASFSGPYDKYVIPGTSTENALGSLLKEANCLMLPVDDTIQQDAETFTTLLSLVTGGVEKLRLNWDAKEGGSVPFEEGFNASLLITSNFDVSSVIGSGSKHQKQMQAEAARTRTLEIPSELIKSGNITDTEWRDAKRLIAGNYGHAVDKFLRYVTDNQVKIYEALSKQEELYRELLGNYAQPEKRGQVRFWARWLAASAVCAKVICDKCNLLPWSPSVIINAGIEIAKDATATAHESDEMLVEAFWDSFKDRNTNEPDINRLHLAADSPAQWNWMEDPRTTRRQHTCYKTGSPVQTIHDGNSYRAMLESIDLIKDGHPVQRERTVYMTMTALRAHVNMHKGDALPVSDWSDLCTRLLNVGCVVLGVRREQPNKLDMKNRVQVDLQERPNAHGGPRKSVVEIRLPPVTVYR